MKWLGTTTPSVLAKRYLVEMLRSDYTQKVSNIEPNWTSPRVEIGQVPEPPLRCTKKLNRLRSPVTFWLSKLLWISGMPFLEFQRLWSCCFTQSIKPVHTATDVTYIAGTTTFDVLPSLLNVHISVLSVRLPNPSTDLKREPIFVVDSVLDHALPETILLVIRDWNASSTLELTSFIDVLVRSKHVTPVFCSRERPLPQLSQNIGPICPSPNHKSKSRLRSQSSKISKTTSNSIVCYSSYSKLCLQDNLHF